MLIPAITAWCKGHFLLPDLLQCETSLWIHLSPACSAIRGLSQLADCQKFLLRNSKMKLSEATPPRVRV